MKIIFDIITISVEVLLGYVEILLRIPQLLLNAVAAGLSERLYLIRIALQRMKMRIEHYRTSSTVPSASDEDSLALALPFSPDSGYARTQESPEMRAADRFMACSCLGLLLLCCCSCGFLYFLLNARR